MTAGWTRWRPGSCRTAPRSSLAAAASPSARSGCGGPLTGHDGTVDAVAAGALRDGTPVIISGGGDATVRVWRLADGAPLMPPLDLPESVGAVAVHRSVIITAAGADIAVHESALPRLM